MTFSLRGFFYFTAFLAALALALDTQEGRILPWFGIGGIAAVVLVDWLLAFGPLLGRRRRVDRARPDA
jgi:uncharacterized membrane protein